MNQKPAPLPLTLLFARSGFKLDPNKPLGRQSAGQSFLDAYLRYSGNTNHSLVVTTQSDFDWFHNEACSIHADALTEAVGPLQWGNAASTTGAFHVPDPCINKWAWKRMP